MSSAGVGLARLDHGLHLPFFSMSPDLTSSFPHGSHGFKGGKGGIDGHRFWEISWE